MQPTITHIRPVLLSAPYADPEDLEVLLHLPSGQRTTGLVEITLNNGIVGLGEGYLAVFAPHVFSAIVDLIAPSLVGRPLTDSDVLLRDIGLVTGYWSLQGAAQHVVSAFEIALQDCRARMLGLPVWRMLGGEPGGSLRLYASGGDATGPWPMARELDRIHSLGIDTVKIRARRHQVDKTRWCQREGASRKIEVAVDMTQNLADPSQTIEEVSGFLEALEGGGGAPPVFLEEALGPREVGSLPRLRELARQRGTRIAGGEIVTTACELCARMTHGCYDIAQPDASVIGGIGAVLRVFEAARPLDIGVYVHCWGGPVGMMANYHAAFAGGGRVAEWPVKNYPLREAMLGGTWPVEHGRLAAPDAPGLGVTLTPAIERAFPFREEAVYRCLVDPSRIPPARW